MSCGCEVCNQNIDELNQDINEETSCCEEIPMKSATCDSETHQTVQSTYYRQQQQQQQKFVSTRRRTAYDDDDDDVDEKELEMLSWRRDAHAYDADTSSVRDFGSGRRSPCVVGSQFSESSEAIQHQHQHCDGNYDEEYDDEMDRGLDFRCGICDPLVDDDGLSPDDGHITEEDRMMVFYDFVKSVTTPCEPDVLFGKMSALEMTKKHMVAICAEFEESRNSFQQGLDQLWVSECHTATVEGRCRDVTKPLKKHIQFESKTLRRDTQAVTYKYGRDIVNHMKRYVKLKFERDFREIEIENEVRYALADEQHVCRYIPILNQGPGAMFLKRGLVELIPGLSLSTCMNVLITSLSHSMDGFLITLLITRVWEMASAEEENEELDTEGTASVQNYSYAIDDDVNFRSEPHGGFHCRDKRYRTFFLSVFFDAISNQLHKNDLQAGFILSNVNTLLSSVNLKSIDKKVMKRWQTNMRHVADTLFEINAVARYISAIQNSENESALEVTEQLIYGNIFRDMLDILDETDVYTAHLSKYSLWIVLAYFNLTRPCIGRSMQILFEVLRLRSLDYFDSIMVLLVVDNMWSSVEYPVKPKQVLYAVLMLDELCWKDDRRSLEDGEYLICRIVKSMINLTFSCAKNISTVLVDETVKLITRIANRTPNVLLCLSEPTIKDKYRDCPGIAKLLKEFPFNTWYPTATSFRSIHVWKNAYGCNLSNIMTSMDWKGRNELDGQLLIPCSIQKIANNILDMLVVNMDYKTYWFLLTCLNTESYLQDSESFKSHLSCATGCNHQLSSCHTLRNIELPEAERCFTMARERYSEKWASMLNLIVKESTSAANLLIIERCYDILCEKDVVRLHQIYQVMSICFTGDIESWTSHLTYYVKWLDRSSPQTCARLISILIVVLMENFNDGKFVDALRSLSIVVFSTCKSTVSIFSISSIDDQNSLKFVDWGIRDAHYIDHFMLLYGLLFDNSYKDHHQKRSECWANIACNLYNYDITVSTICWLALLRSLNASTANDKIKWIFAYFKDITTVDEYVEMTTEENKVDKLLGLFENDLTVFLHGSPADVDPPWWFDIGNTDVYRSLFSHEAWYAICHGLRIDELGVAFSMKKTATYKNCHEVVIQNLNTEGVVEFSCEPTPGQQESKMLVNQLHTFDDDLNVIRTEICDSGNMQIVVESDKSIMKDIKFLDSQKACEYGMCRSSIERDFDFSPGIAEMSLSACERRIIDTEEEVEKLMHLKAKLWQPKLESTTASLSCTSLINPLHKCTQPATVAIAIVTNKVNHTVQVEITQAQSKLHDLLADKHYLDNSLTTAATNLYRTCLLLEVHACKMFERPSANPTKYDDRYHMYYKVVKDVENYRRRGQKDVNHAHYATSMKLYCRALQLLDKYHEFVTGTIERSCRLSFEVFSRIQPIDHRVEEYQLDCAFKLSLKHQELIVPLITCECVEPCNFLIEKIIGTEGRDEGLVEKLLQRVPFKTLHGDRRKTAMELTANLLKALTYFPPTSSCATHLRNILAHSIIYLEGPSIFKFMKRCNIWRACNHTITVLSELKPRGDYFSHNLEVYVEEVVKTLGTVTKKNIHVDETIDYVVWLLGFYTGCVMEFTESKSDLSKADSMYLIAKADTCFREAVAIQPKILRYWKRCVFDNMTTRECTCDGAHKCKPLMDHWDAGCMLRSVIELACELKMYDIMEEIIFEFDWCRYPQVIYGNSTIAHLANFSSTEHACLLALSQINWCTLSTRNRLFDKTNRWGIHEVRLAIWNLLVSPTLNIIEPAEYLLDAANALWLEPISRPPPSSEKYNDDHDDRLYWESEEATNFLKRIIDGGGINENIKYSVLTTVTRNDSMGLARRLLETSAMMFPMTKCGSWRWTRRFDFIRFLLTNMPGTLSDVDVDKYEVYLENMLWKLEEIADEEDKYALDSSQDSIHCGSKIFGVLEVLQKNDNPRGLTCFLNWIDAMASNTDGPLSMGIFLTWMADYKITPSKLHSSVFKPIADKIIRNLMETAASFSPVAGNAASSGRGTTLITFRGFNNGKINTHGTQSAVRIALEQKEFSVALTGILNNLNLRKIDIQETVLTFNQTLSDIDDICSMDELDLQSYLTLLYIFLSKTCASLRFSLQTCLKDIIWPAEQRSNVIVHSLSKIWISSNNNHQEKERREKVMSALRLIYDWRPSKQFQLHDELKQSYPLLEIVEKQFLMTNDEHIECRESYEKNADDHDDTDKDDDYDECDQDGKHKENDDGGEDDENDE